MQAADQVLTVRQMQAAEQALIDGGETVSSLMDTAGRGAADWVWRMAAGRPVTVLCGPGNNGGDGYVIAETLRARGLAVVVVAPLEPRTDAGIAARAAFQGELADGGVGGVLVDCLFGSGLARPLSAGLADLLARLAQQHHACVAIDLPSGIESDTGALLNDDLPPFDLTVALGAWKFAHWMLPARELMGVRRLVDIGVSAVDGSACVIDRPALVPPAVDGHKYLRGLLAVVGGPMPGAALLAARAALHGGAGYVKVLGQAERAPAELVVDDRPLDQALADERIAAILVGPGLQRDAAARERLSAVLGTGAALVLDADALHLLGPSDLHGRPAVLTPHAGELAALCEAFGIAPISRLADAKALSQAADAVVIAKGPDTLVVAPDGRVALAPPASSWLSTAGTGDVLAGIVASRLATGVEPFAAACQAVWLHGEAARGAGPAFSAGELAGKVAQAYAACL